jgi:glucose-6-phosphate isomerase
MVGIFKDLLQEQGFWEARTHFTESPQKGNFYPTYMHLRNLDNHDSPKVLQVKEDLDWIKSYSEKIRQGDFYGFSGQKITDVVNIGMGGSDLGPRLCVTALAQYKSTEINFHFRCGYLCI